jgi:hypothetical protein
MKIFQKIIVFMIIFSLLISPVFNLLTFRPKQAKALDGGGAIMLFLKEIGLDLISAFLRDVVIKNLERKIMDWSMGRNTDANEPFAVIDWTKFFHEALDYASARFIQQYNLTSYCAPIQLSLGSRFGLTTYYFDRPTYPMFASCTLDQIVDNVENFMRNPRISVYGMDAWRTLTQPQNNILGSYFLAQEELEKIEEEEDRAADKETAVSNGYKNETATTKTDVDACKEGCTQKSNQDCIDECGGRSATEQCVEDCLANQGQACLDSCENLPGVAVEKTIKNLGSQIYGRVEKTLDTHIERIISVEEITELVSIFFTALINKATNGMGLMFNALFASKTDRARAENKDQYAYRREFQKTLTTEKKTDARSQVLNNVLKAVQQLDRSIIACKEAEMIPYDDWTKEVADVIENNVEALYVGLHGANIKPDFEVLDHPLAPYTVYGYSWGEVPWQKIPDKCRTVIQQYYVGTGMDDAGAKSAALSATCQKIVSNLEPPTPTLADLQADGKTVWTTNPTTDCTRCMYDHDHLNCEPGPYPPQKYADALKGELWTDTIHQQKDEFWWWCKGTYNATINRCDECLKKADEKCNQTDQTQKEACISSVCNNYNDINIQNLLSTDNPATDINETALDFYGRCLIEEQQEACYTCLSEYYVPAYICTDVFDYTSRSIMKYPAVVKRERSGADDKGEIWGLANTDILGRGDQCDDNYDPQNLNLALICRIMPEFTFGTQSCRTTCNKAGMTQEQLLDITDFRPNDKDCANATIAACPTNNTTCDNRPPGGGRNPWNPVNDGVRRIRGKCCAASAVDNPATYAMCVGGGTSGNAEDLCKGAGKWWLRPECWCKEGERPFGEASTSYPKPLLCCPTTDRDCYGARDYTNSPSCRKACGNLEFTVPNMNKRNLTTVKTNAAPGGSVVVISSGKCTSNGSDCFYSMSNPSLYERLAEIFEPLLPSIAYAQECSCNTGADCADDERCAQRPLRCCPRGEIDCPYSGECVPRLMGGNCNCNNDSECSGETPICDLPVPGESLPCTEGTTGKTGICVAGDPDVPDCDPAVCTPSNGAYTGTAPTPINATCKVTTTNSRGAEACCTDEGWPNIGGGGVTMTCNLGGVSPGTKLYLSVTSDNFTDCKTGANLCIPCDPGDPGYPSYGITDPKTGAPIDQCNGKIQ